MLTEIGSWKIGKLLKEFCNDTLVNRKEILNAIKIVDFQYPNHHLDHIGDRPLPLPHL